MGWIATPTALANEIPDTGTGAPRSATAVADRVDGYGVARDRAVGRTCRASVDVVSPSDGDVVSSRPNFAVDYAEGTLEVEFAVDADTKSAGDDVGAFVDAIRSNFMLVGGANHPLGLAEWGLSPRLNAGRYFWHARPNDYLTEIERGFKQHPWGPTRTLTVRDEPIVFEGWTLRKQRISRSRCQPRYKRAFLLSGSVAYDDNDARMSARYTMKLSDGSRSVAFRGTFSSGASRFAKVVCTNRASATVTMKLRDRAEQVTVGPVKRLRFR